MPHPETVEQNRGVQVLRKIPGEENSVNDLLIQDTFEPYYAGRRGYAAPESPRRRKPAEKKEAVAAEGKVEAPENRPAAAGDH